MIHSMQALKKTLRYGLCVGALCLVGLPSWAAPQPSPDCSGVKKAIGQTRQANYDGAVDLLTQGEWRSRDLAMQCFFNRVSRMKKITPDDYWGLGDAFLAAFRDDADNPETALAGTYLDGAEVAYRRADVSAFEMPGTGFIEILVEQAEAKGHAFLRKEAQLLLGQHLLSGVTVPADAPWHVRILAWKEQGMAPQKLDAEIFDFVKVQGIEPPVKVRVGPPTYPERARMARVQGTIVVQTVIDARGRIQDVFLIQGGAMGLSEEAVRTMKSWRFKPAKLDGKPVPVYYNLTMNFKLK